VEESMLLPIVRRLNAMRCDTSGKRQRRMFEQFGIPVCEVTYVRESDEFILCVSVHRNGSALTALT
jgi:Uncharacterized protein conserved in bacteria